MSVELMSLRICVSLSISGSGGLSRSGGKDVDDRSARLTKHEAPHSPLLVAERVGDREALRHGLGVDYIDVRNLERDVWRRHVLVVDDGYLS
jgi:hypothetical protein